MASKFEVGKTYYLYFGNVGQYYVKAVCTKITKKMAKFRFSHRAARYLGLKKDESMFLRREDEYGNEYVTICKDWHVEKIMYSTDTCIDRIVW